MPTETPKVVEIKEGSEITTIHGEKIKVLKVAKDLHGRKVLAKSGDTNCWFYEKSLKLS